MGLVAPRHVGSSQTRDRTRVPCIGRWILNHWATREARLITFDVDLDHLDEILFVRFLHCKVTPCTPASPILPFLDGNHYAQPTLKESGDRLRLCEGGVST